MKNILSTIALVLAFNFSALADDTFVPPDRGSPEGTHGSGTRVFDCSRGGSRQGGC